MKNLKKNNGITLVALAITIVVLLILAGISINMMIGDNGLITKSKEIQSNIEQAEAEGQNKINSLQEAEYTEDGVVIQNDSEAPTINSMEIIDITDTSFTVKVNVTETGSGLAKIEYSIDDGENYITPNYNQAKSYTFEDLKVGFEEYKVKVKATDANNNSSYASKLIGKLKIGDYVNYTYDTVASGYKLTKEQSGYTNSNADDGSQTIAQSSTTLKWRILNIDEANGTIDLVSATTTNNAVYFQGALGYNNGVYLLNEICAKLYSNSSKGITARSINLEDTEKHFTDAGLAARNVYNNGTATYGSTKTYTDSKSYYPKLYAYEIGSGVNVTEANASSISQPNNGITNPDPYKESKNSPSTSFTVPTTETYTQATDEARNHNLTVTKTAYDNINFNDSNKYYDEAGAVLKSSSSYWVASRYAYCYSSYAFFGLRFASSCMKYTTLIDTYVCEWFGGCLLRPVVSLKSNTIDIRLGKDEKGAWQIK